MPSVRPTRRQRRRMQRAWRSSKGFSLRASSRTASTTTSSPQIMLSPPHPPLHPPPPPPRHPSRRRRRSSSDARDAERASYPTCAPSMNGAAPLFGPPKSRCALPPIQMRCAHWHGPSRGSRGRGMGQTPPTPVWSCHRSPTPTTGATRSSRVASVGGPFFPTDCRFTYECARACALAWPRPLARPPQQRRRLRRGRWRSWMSCSPPT